MPEPFSATTPIKSVKGTVSKPGVTFSGDENTGLYNSGPDQLAVSTGGNNVATFSSTGLDINGGISFDGELPVENVPFGMIAGLSIALG